MKDQKIYREQIHRAPPQNVFKEDIALQCLQSLK